MNRAFQLVVAMAGLMVAACDSERAEGTPIGSELDLPVALAQAPDGRVFVTEKNSGDVRLLEADGQLAEDPVIHFDVATDGEWGLLGIALHPGFEDNHFVYVYYMEPKVEGRSHPVIVRFREENGSGTDAEVIVDNLPLTEISVGSPTVDLFSNIHVGGNLHFGPDGFLYVAIGDFGVFQAKAQDVAEPLGKILRLDDEGQPAPGNPFSDEPDADPRVYAYGLRNPFDFDWAPDGTLYAVDNGPDACDEVNIIVAGGDYGWPSNRLSSTSCDRRDGMQALHYLARPDSEPHKNGSTVGPSSLLYLEEGFAGEDGPGVVVCEVNSGRLGYLRLAGDGAQVVGEKTLAEDCFTDVIQLADGDLLYARPDGLTRLDPK